MISLLKSWKRKVAHHRLANNGMNLTSVTKSTVEIADLITCLMIELNRKFQKSIDWTNSIYFRVYPLRSERHMWESDAVFIRIRALLDGSTNSYIEISCRKFSSEDVAPKIKLSLTDPKSIEIITKIVTTGSI